MLLGKLSDVKRRRQRFASLPPTGIDKKNFPELCPHVWKQPNLPVMVTSMRAHHPSIQGDLMVHMDHLKWFCVNVTHTNVFPRAKHENPSNLPPTHTHTHTHAAPALPPLPREASADGSFVVRRRGTIISILELLAISLGRKQAMVLQRWSGLLRIP